MATETSGEILEQIFGPGAAADLPPEERDAVYVPEPIVFGRHIRLKVTPSGHVSLTHPEAPLGRHGEVRTVQINSIPPGVSDAEVVRLYAGTADLTDSPMWEFERLGIGRILRPLAAEPGDSREYGTIAL